MFQPTSIIDVLSGLLPRTGRVLDVGCGNGALVEWLRRLGLEASGIDPKVDAAQPGPGLIPGSAQDLPVPGEQFQSILMINSFHHVPAGEMDRALGEAARALAPGGRLIVVEPLAKGDWFELLCPVDDETAVRAAATAALDRAATVGFVRPSLLPELHGGDNPIHFTVEHRVADVDAVLAGFSNVDPQRRARAQAARDAVAVLFERTGRAAEGGRVFQQPMRADMFDLPRDTAIVRFAHGQDEVKAALGIRNIVFCQEQGVSQEAEIDGLDPQCDHLVATLQGQLVGTARLRAYGDDPVFGKIERVAVLREARGLGIGERLVRLATQVLEARGHRVLLLNAQVHAEGFYQRLGYWAEGEPFDDEGIPHIAMLRRV